MSSLTAVLDISAVVHAGIDGIPSWQARQTFAMARHAAVDLSQVLVAPPKASERMTSTPSERIVDALGSAGYHFKHGRDASQRLTHLRKMYEPYVAGLSAALLGVAVPVQAQRVLGLDVSAWQGNLSVANWDTLKATTASKK